MDERVFRVSCVIVTYADRRIFLCEIIKRLHDLEPQPESIVIVFNGVPYDAVQFVTANQGPVKIHSVVLPDNTGSAGGYATALSSAAENTLSDYFWLLDDDNCPALNALNMLYAAFLLLGPSPNNLLLSLRTDRWEYIVAAHTGRHPGIRKNSFFNFDLTTAFLSKFSGGRPFKISPNQKSNYPLVCVPNAPYGGLLLHRMWLERVGLPRIEYFLYEDDHEYTDRITKSGGRIYLCAASEVNDIDESWFLTGNLKCHYLLDPSASEMRACYGLRNRVATEWQGHVSIKVLYFLNMIIFFVRHILGAYKYWFKKAFWRRLGLLFFAIYSGLKGDFKKIIF